MSLTSSVRDEIERKILGGHFEAGKRINENSIATQLGVSRTIVREAIRTLEQAGLVEIVANRGAVVRRPTVVEVLNLYDIRAALSYAAGRLAALRITKAQIERLLEKQRQMDEARQADNDVAYDDINIEFHALIFEFAGNPRLSQMHEAISKEVRLFVRHGVAGRASLRSSWREHEEILAAIRAGDADAAAKAFEEHVLKGKNRMIENLSLAPAGNGRETRT